MCESIEQNKGRVVDWDRIKSIAGEVEEHILGIPLEKWLRYAVKPGISIGEATVFPQSVAYRIAWLVLGRTTRRQSTGDNLKLFRTMAARALTIKSLYEGNLKGVDHPLVQIYRSYFYKEGMRVTKEKALTSFLDLFPGMSLDQIVNEFSKPQISDWSTTALNFLRELPPLISDYLSELFQYNLI